MDGKAKIRIDHLEEEQVDCSFGYTAACSIFVVMGKGMGPVEQDVDSMKKYVFDIKNKGPGFENLTDFQRDKMVKEVTEQLNVAEICKKQGYEFIKELARVIKELEPKETKKVIIHKPNWNG